MTNLLNFIIVQINRRSTRTAPDDDFNLYLTILVVIAVIVIFWFLYYANIFLWLRAKASKVKISPTDLVILRYKKIPVDKILMFMIMAQEAGVSLDANELSRLYLAQENEALAIKSILEISENMIKAHNAGLNLSLKEAIDYYLAKVDIKHIIKDLILAHNAHVSFTLKELAEQYLAHVDTHVLVHAMIVAHDGDLHNVTKKMLIKHYHAGGDIKAVVEAVVAAKNADEELEVHDHLRLDFASAANIDLAGINIKQAVKDAIDFKVIQTEPISAFAIDGVQLTMSAKITIRPKIRKIVKGAGEDTVLARVNEAIVSEIGSIESHHKILESPYEVAQSVEQKKELFEDTAYDVRSIDISNIEVGKDIRAELKTERAKAKLAEAKAYSAHVESEVSKAMADAFRDGKFSIHDYHNMKNIEADTEMRERIGQKRRNTPNDKNDENKH